MSRTAANLGLLLAAALWGGAFIFQKAGIGTLGDGAFTGARFLLGALAVMPVALKSLGRARLDRWAWLGLGVLGVMVFIGSITQQIGIRSTSSANAGFLTTLYVPLVPLIEWAGFGRRPHPVTWPAAAICLAGAWLLSGADFQPSVGDVWVIASSVFWAVQITLVGLLAARTAAPMLVVFLQFLIGGVLALAWAFAVEAPGLGDFVSAWSGLLYTGLVSVGIAFSLQAVCQRFTSGAIAAVMVSAEAPFAALFGMLALGEMMGGNQLGGAALILVAIILVQVVPAIGGGARVAETKAA